jgi:hypothetical protein
MKFLGMPHINKFFKVHSSGLGIVLANVILNITNFDLLKLQPGLDVSYAYGYNQLLLGGHNYFTKVFFTYGPFGFLVHAVNLGNAKLIMVIFNGLFGLSTGLLIYSLVKRFTTKKQILLAALLSIVVALQVFEWRFMAFLLLLELYYYNKRPVTFRKTAVLSILASFFIFIKFSLGIAGLASVAVWLLLRLKDRAIRDRILHISILPLSVVVMSMLALQTLSLSAIYHYYYYGLNIAFGYVNAMGLQFSEWQLAVIAFVLGSSLAIIIYCLRTKKNGWEILLFLLPALFFAWKAGIVREDAYGHADAFAFFLIFFATILVLSLSRLNYKLRFRDFLCFAAICVLAIYGASFTGLTSQRIVGNLESRLAFWKISTCSLAPCQSINSLVLPKNVRDLISNKTVDVYPWETTYIPVNGLNWLSRPVPGSYSAYTSALDDADAAFFNSPNSPSYVIWPHDSGVDSIDNRYLLFDEPATIRALQSNYVSVYSSPTLSVLTKVSHHKTYILSPMGRSKISLRWGQWLNLSNYNFSLYAKINYSPDLRQELGEVLFRPMPLTITFLTVNNTTYTYRVIPSSLEQGIALNYLPFTVSDLNLFLEHNLTVNVVKAFRINGPKTGNLSVSLYSDKLI